MILYIQCMKTKKVKPFEQHFDNAEQLRRFILTSIYKTDLRILTILDGGKLEIEDQKVIPLRKDPDKII